MARARSNQPTIAERLNRSSLPDPRVRAYGYTEYEGKRPGYVSYNSNAGKAWGDLARALDGFNSSMTKAYTKHREVEIEEGIALGRIAYSETQDSEEALRNKRDFKKFIEENPQFANDNPWIEVGYEQSRLRELGMEAKTGLSKFLDEGGYFNQEDPAVFQSAVNSYFNNFRAQAGLDSYEDKVLMAKWFSPVEADARQSMTTMYDNVKRNARQDKYSNQISSELATQITTALDTDSPLDIQMFSRTVDQARANGLLDKNIVPAVFNAFRIAYADRDDRDILDMVKNVVVFGTKLGQVKEIAEWCDTELDKIIAAEVKADKDDAKSQDKFYKETVKILAFEMSNKLDEVGSFDAMRPSVEEKLGRKLTEIEWNDLRVEAAKKTRERRQADKTERDTPQNKSSVAFEINDIIAQSTTPMQELVSRYHTTQNPAYWEAYERLEKEGITEAKANAKEIKTYVEKVSKAAVEALIRQDAAGIDWVTYSKSKYYMAVSDVKKLAFRQLSAIMQDEKERLAPEGTEFTPEKRERALLNAQQRFEENFVNNGVLTKGYTSESLLSIIPAASSPLAQAMMQAATPEEAVHIESWSQAYSPILDSSAGISKKVKDSINFLLDLRRMASDNVMDASLPTLLKYMKPESQMVGCTLSPDGKTINVPRDPSLSPEDAQERLIRIQNVFEGYEVRFMGQ